MHPAKDDLDFSYVNSRLSYDKTTGILTWKDSRKKEFIGRIAGYTLVDGGIAVKIDKKLYKAHRLAWLLYYGQWPNGDLDHIDGNRANNKINNLRIASIRQNGQNRKENRNKPCGTRRSFNKWHATITINKKRVFLGSYDTELEAHNAYLSALKSYNVEPYYGVDFNGKKTLQATPRFA